MARQARGRFLVAAVALAVLGGAACHEKKRTEIVLGLATDLTAPTPLRSVHLQVLRLPENVPIGDADFPISGTASQMYGLPGTYAVFSDNGTPDRVRVILTARDDAGATLVVRKAVLTLVPEKTLFVRLGVVSACRGKTDCGDDDVTTCVDGRCAPQAIDTTRLPDYHPGDEKQVACTGGPTTFIDTDTGQSLTAAGTTCGAGTCQEGVCLAPPAASDGGGVDAGDASDASDVGDAGDASDASDATVVPQLTSLSPAQGTAGTSVSIEVHGADIAPGWSIVFDGAPIATTYGQAADGPTAIGTVAIATAIATGQVPVWLASDVRHSNTLYFTVTPAAGAPTIIDYTPDNGIAGSQISIVGTNLIAEPVTISDALGRQILVAGTGTTTWVGAAVDRVDIVIPSGLGSGVLTASNSKGSFRGRIFNIGQNLSRMPGVVATASTQFNTTNWSMASGFDNNLQTSWFTAHGDCATLTTCTTRTPFFQIAFPTPQLIGRIAMRGNREYASGYDFVEGTFTILDANGVSLWSEDRLLPDPDRDLDIVIVPSVAGASAVRFTSVSDQSDEPGFSELEVFGP